MKNAKYIFLVLAALLIVSAPAFATTERLGANLPVQFSASKTLAKTAAYTVTTSDAGAVINVTATSANIVITLPSIADLNALGSSFPVKIVKADSTDYKIVVTPASGNTVGGGSTRYLVNQNDYMVIQPGPIKNDWGVYFESPYISENHETGLVTFNGLASTELTSDTVLSGTTPLLTIGDAGEEDAGIVFDGNAQDFYIGLDDTADDLIIGKGSAFGTTPAIKIDENQMVTIGGAVTDELTITAAIQGASPLILDGVTDDANEITIAVTDPGADYTLTIPAVASGTFAMTAGLASNATYSVVTDNVTLTTADCGKVLAIATDAKTITLPATAAGCVIRIVNSGAAGNNIITIDPNAADNIWGTFTLAASVVVSEGAAGVTIVNTKATSQKGDSVTLVGDGADGWYILNSTGIWAEGA